MNTVIGRRVQEVGFFQFSERVCDIFHRVPEVQQANSSEWFKGSAPKKEFSAVSDVERMKGTLRK
jgi:hypothetical protein